jgi:ADP-heptose:LPS heptosyltransferase
MTTEKLKNVSYFDPNQKIPPDFDILYNLDTEKVATDLASSINAKLKFGFYEEDGYPVVFNSGAEYYLNIIFDDELKKNNKKTYQEMMYELAEITYNKQHCSLVLARQDIEYAKRFKMSNKLNDKKIIGIHMGASARWPSKVWSPTKIKEFIIECSKLQYGIILFGGPNEVHSHKELSQDLSKLGVSFARNDPHNSDLEFAALVNMCDTVVCSDSFSLHVSLALLRKTICLFFCTSPNEIEGYDKLTKLVSPRLYEFFPERMDEYSKDLVNSISVKEVIDSL